jgi:hypothetical protein
LDSASSLPTTGVISNIALARVKPRHHSVGTKSRQGS